MRMEMAILVTFAVITCAATIAGIATSSPGLGTVAPILGGIVVIMGQNLSLKKEIRELRDQVHK